MRPHATAVQADGEMIVLYNHGRVVKDDMIYSLIIVTFFAVSVVSCCLIVWLLYSEISYYLDANFKFRFVPDSDFDAKLKINVDVTVAMPCLGKCQLDKLERPCKSTEWMGKLHEKNI
jgi:hypothetical protein